METGISANSLLETSLTQSRFELTKNCSENTTPAKAKYTRWLFLLAILSAFPIFSHGCHRDVDDEPGLIPEVRDQKSEIRSQNSSSYSGKRNCNEVGYE